MQSIVWEGYKSIEETVSELLGPQDSVIFDFEVMPLDYYVKDVLTPRIFVSQHRLVLVVDEKIEVYNLKDIWIVSSGGPPKFALTHQLLEYRIMFNSQETPLSKNVETPMEWVRFSIIEKGVQAKEFVLRKGLYPAKGYQTWSFAQRIRNIQKDYPDYQVDKMVYGSFSFFEGSFLVSAFLAFVVYLLISLIFGGILPSFLKTFIDTLFSIFCVFMLFWVYWTIFINTRKYRKIYEKYNPVKSTM